MEEEDKVTPEPETKPEDDGKEYTSASKKNMFKLLMKPKDLKEDKEEKKASDDYEEEMILDDDDFDSDKE